MEEPPLIPEAPLYYRGFLLVKVDGVGQSLGSAQGRPDEGRRRSMKSVVLDGFALNPGDLSWKGLEALGA